MDETGKPVPWNALYDGVQVWPPAAETLTDVWLKPVGFTSQALYSDHPELKIGAQKVFADGHIEDADSVFSCSDASVASISDANLLSIVSNATTMLAVLKNDACRPAVVGVNVPDSDSKMTVIYHSPSNTTKTVTMYWRLLTDAASDSQPHGSVTMTSLATVFQSRFRLWRGSGFSLAFQRDGNDEAWSNPAKQDATKHRLVYVADTAVSYPPSASKQVLVQPDQPTTAPVGSLWCRTEKLHNGLKYYTGSVGDDANVMCFLIDVSARCGARNGMAGNY